MNTFIEQYKKISIISIIQMIERKIYSEFSETTFNKLNKLSYKELTNKRDNILIEYNNFISNKSK